MDLRGRLERVRQHGWQVLQCALGASLALLLAQQVLGHPQPVFAPIAAVVALGVSYGNRLRRVGEVVVGVALGVLIGDLLVHVAGSGAWQIALVVALGQAVAIFLRAGVLMINQAAIQGVFVTTLVTGPAAGLDRWLDAVTGGAVALALAALAPAAPLRRPLRLASALLAEVADLLWEASAAARAGDAERAREALAHARSTQTRLDALRAAAADGLEVLRVSPFRRRAGHGVRSVAALAEPLDRAVRNVRVLARRLAVTTDRHEPVPPALLDLVDSLAAASLRLGEDLAEVRDPTPAVQALAAVARDSVDVPRSTLSSDVVLAQVRSTTVDLLQVAGLDDHEVALLVPRDMPTLPPTGAGTSRVDDD